MAARTEKARQYWAVVSAMPAPLLSMLARQAEERSYHGLFAPQVHGAPFPTLAVAAAATERLQVASGVAIASARSPFETAMTAMDMDRLSGGRFILGLGASATPWTQGFHGVPKRKPLTDLKETVRAVRYIVANAHKGLKPFEGEYYRADFAEFQPTEPPVREEIPIWTAALGKPAVRLAGEISNGLMGHPMWTLQWAEDLVTHDLTAGLEKSGRRRKDVHVNLWIWAAPHEDSRQGIDDARATVAFYAGISQYEAYFDRLGFGDVARRVQAPIRAKDLAAASKIVPDEMVRACVACGSESDVRDYVERAWRTADSLCLVPPPWGNGLEKYAGYHERIGAFVASEVRPESSGV